MLKLLFQRGGKRHVFLGSSSAAGTVIEAFLFESFAIIIFKPPTLSITFIYHMLGLVTAALAHHGLNFESLCVNNRLIL